MDLPRALKWCRAIGLAALAGAMVGIRAVDEPLILGMSTALTGPAANLGREMRMGVEAAIAEVNLAGGVNGRPISLIALDDGYEPSRTAPNMRSLVGNEKVLAIVGNVGTPTGVVAVPIAVERGTPFVGAFTGAGALRKSPPDTCVVNLRASYAEETGAMVDALISKGGLKPEEIAFFTQADAYGDAGFSGGLAAIKRHGLSDASRIAHGRYERNTLAVENGLADILSAPTPVRGVIMVGAYAPCAAFLKLANESGLHAVFLSVSFVGAESLAQAAGKAGEGVIITQVVPPPLSGAPIAVQFRAALAKSEPGALPTWVSLEGYAAMRMLILGLGRAGEHPTRAGVNAALLGLGEFDLGFGEPLHLSPASTQACHRVWPTVIRDGMVVPMEWDQLRPSRGSEGH